MSRFQRDEGREVVGGKLECALREVDFAPPEQGVLVGRRDLQDGCEVAGRLLVPAFARKGAEWEGRDGRALIWLNGALNRFRLVDDVPSSSEMAGGMEPPEDQNQYTGGSALLLRLVGGWLRGSKAGE